MKDDFAESHPLLRLCENSGNPTHGSGWMVQVLPTNRAVRPLFFYYLPLSPRGTRGEKQNKNQDGASSRCRLGLNHPPTIRGWDSKSFRTVSAVGGIFPVFIWSLP